tara:strand:+ start:290 stop:688 length:399 start_codon:yes stop_codon:yes gene_type:complete
MYAKIESNKIVELDSVDHSGDAGWQAVSDSDRDSGVSLVYDTGTSAVRQQTDAEKTAEYTAVTLSDAWLHLRGQRNGFLRGTDEYMSTSDRPATTNMPEYRVYLRGLPATYNDVSILSQTAVMDFDAYVASL